MPADAATCSCPDFINGLKKKLSHNFEIIDQQLQKINCDCDFRNVKKKVQERYSVTLEIIAVLSDCNPNMETLNIILNKYEVIKKDYNLVFRDDIASQSTRCSDLLIRLRSIPSTTAENIIAAVLKCLNFEKCN